MDGTAAHDRVAVVGTGAWGTVLATLLVQAGATTTLLCRDEAEAGELRSRRENRRFLPGVRLPEALCFDGDPAEALQGAGLVVLAVPAQRLRENLRWIGAALDPSADLLCASKGIELHSGLRMSEVIRQALGERAGASLTLSGPNLSSEIVRGLPAASVVAGPPEQAAAARAVQQRFSSERFRLYTSSDQAGVEIGGALKNVIAIACGICDGLGYGHNARAGLMTRGLAEITRLARACGGRTRTVAGLAGMGDLVATVASTASRNYALGLALGRGKQLAEITAGSVHVAEGVPSTSAALALAARLGIELPVTAQLAAVLSGECTPEQGARALMRRALIAE
ncbi:MAG TPA: NAD(P)H-dependent glycerol-3-phosphate dehydrogenase [Dehalococcoidia bacterium]